MIRRPLPVFPEKQANVKQVHDSVVCLPRDYMVPAEDDDMRALLADDPDIGPDDPLEGIGLGHKPPTYRRAYNKIARNMRMLGYRTEEIAEVLGVSLWCISSWKQTYPTFATAWEDGGVVADGKVARALFKRATGYRHPSVKIFNDKDKGIIEVPYTEHYAPDTGAATYWLNNRQRDRWKSSNSTELSGPNGKDLNLPPPSINVMVIAAPEKTTPLINGHASTE